MPRVWLTIEWFRLASTGTTGVTQLCLTCLSSSMRLNQACSHGSSRGTRKKANPNDCTSPFQPFAYVTFAIIPSARASYIVSPESEKEDTADDVGKSTGAGKDTNWGPLLQSTILNLGKLRLPLGVSVLHFFKLDYIYLVGWLKAFSNISSVRHQQSQKYVF